MKTWEYLIEEVDLAVGKEEAERRFDLAGELGFELVSAFPISCPDSDAAKLLALFKADSCRRKDSIESGTTRLGRQGQAIIQTGGVPRRSLLRKRCPASKRSRP